MKLDTTLQTEKICSQYYIVISPRALFVLYLLIYYST